MKNVRRYAVAGALAACLVGVVWRERVVRVSASEAETDTWGATDPSWSPDGARIAFSLFGSIWEVSARGGEARQVSASAGYHAHPAWSPKGDKIAFIRGRAPGGRVPNVAGRLVLADVSGLAEREIATRWPVAGRVAWSADGEKIWCALRAPEAGALLHEIRVADGVATPIQFQAQGPGPAVAAAAGGARRTASWIDVAANPKRAEVYYTSAPEGVPQIWSLAPGGPPVTVQLPLTRYRREDVAALDGISPVPDGSGLVYSAVVVNGKGDYELYRVPRGGGAPVALTNTPRDEFAPAVSPDGKLVAHVSNHMGNIDLFTMPIGGGEKTHVRITGLKFRAPSARLRLRTLDEMGQPTPVRLYVRAADGKAYCPAGAQIFYYPLEASSDREGFFVTSGDDAFPVPAGRVQLFARKGIEYDLAERAIEAAAGETTDVTIQMQRWTNWRERGWYTGENHFHANYNGSYYQRPKQSLAWLEAEDLNTANLVVANSTGAFIHDKEFFRGRVDPLSKPSYVLYWGQEYRNHFPLGHMAFLNIKKQVPPSFTSVIGSSSPYDFPLNTMAALEARKQGGLVTYVHPMTNARDVFDTNLGAKEAPVGAALGAVDAMDILPFGEDSYELWYRLLNAGARIVAGAGTDVFTNWRGINRVPGGSRQYVETGGSMDWDRWIERFRAGRNFVTNGPLMTFSVNGEPLGAEIRAPAGQPYRAKLVAEVSSRTPLEAVEFIQNGQAIETRRVEGDARSLRLEKDIAVERSCWFAVRARGRPARGTPGGIPQAHSSPIWVRVGASPPLIKEDVELMVRWIDRLWALLEERDNFGPGRNREAAREMIQRARRHYMTQLDQAW